MPLLFIGYPIRVLSDTIIGVLNAYRKRIELQTVFADLPGS